MAINPVVNVGDFIWWREQGTGCRTGGTVTRITPTGRIVVGAGGVTLNPDLTQYSRNGRGSPIVGFLATDPSIRAEIEHQHVARNLAAVAWASFPPEMCEKVWEIVKTHIKGG